MATGVVECGERPQAEGEVYARLEGGGKLMDYVKPKWRVAVISTKPAVEVRCGDKTVELKGLEVSYGEAKVLAEEYVGREGRP